MAVSASVRSVTPASTLKNHPSAGAVVVRRATPVRHSPMENGAGQIECGKVDTLTVCRVKTGIFYK